MPEPAWPEWARAADAPPDTTWFGGGDAPSWRRALVPLLLVALAAQTALLAWLWSSSDRGWLPVSTPMVAITSEPPRAAVLIDGIARGTTPLELDLEPGRYQVQIGVEGAAWTQVLDVSPGVNSSVHVVHTGGGVVGTGGVEAATLEITTDPPGLAVSVDGRDRGVSPISVTGLEPGTHEVSVTRGASVVRRTVAVENGVPTAVLISTAPSGSGVSSGWLAVKAPVPVQIHESGTLLGSSETPRLLLPIGRHDLEFVNERFGYRARRAVQIRAGQAATVALEPATGTLSVNALPWGEVWIDGQRVGETPIGNLPLPIGTHELVVRHPQFGERRQTVAVSAAAPARVGIDLRK